MLEHIYENIAAKASMNRPRTTLGRSADDLKLSANRPSFWPKGLELEGAAVGGQLQRLQGLAQHVRAILNGLVRRKSRILR
jgi:hypothetical protein